jgi:hypothetical protein
VANAGLIYRRLRLVLEQGLTAIADKPPPVRSRLEEAREFVAYIEHQVPALLDQFVADRETTRPAGAG